MKNTMRVVVVMACVWILAIMAACLSGCSPRPTPEPSPDATQRTKYSPLVAVAAAEASMQEEAAPMPDLPDPDDTGGDTGVKPGGPFDLLRDARALVDKGNKLADRGKSILDKAEAEGKVTIDLRLPGGDAKTDKPHGGCTDDTCRVQPPAANEKPTAEESGQYDCSDGSCYERGPIRRFFRRRR